VKTYTKADVSEQQLEDLVRVHAGLIEEGLVYVDHQKPAAGGLLDVLMVDSGRALVVAELKVVQDDEMLLQGLDYYDYVSSHIESFSRLYKAHSIDPTQQVRLILVAPSFSQSVVNRCKWLSIKVSLFTYTCLKLSEVAVILIADFMNDQPVTDRSDSLATKDHEGQSKKQENNRWDDRWRRSVPDGIGTCVWIFSRVPRLAYHVANYIAERRTGRFVTDKAAIGLPHFDDLIFRDPTEIFAIRQALDNSMNVRLQ
jgi:hypothetical protein